MKRYTQRYRLITYDLWPDGDGGMSVNDCYDKGIIEFRVTDPESGPTDLQISRAVGARGCSYDGEAEYTIYATDRKGNPAFELRREEQ